MRCKLNVKLLGWTALAAALAAAGVILLHDRQVARNSQLFLEQARRAARARDPGQASAYYRQYLAHRPDDTDVLTEYARSLAGPGSAAGEQYEAFELMEQALRRRPGDRALRREAVRVAAGLYDHAGAERHLRSLVKDDPADAEAWYLLGGSRQALGDYGGAEAAYREAARLDPANINAHLDLARLLCRQLQRPGEVVQVLDEMVRVNPDAYLAYLARGKYLGETGDRAAAFADLQKALALDATDPRTVLTLAALQRQQGQADAARRTLTDGLARHPRDLDMYQALARLESAVGRPAAAADWLRRGLDRVPGSAELRLALAEALVEAGSRGEAAAALDRLRGEGGMADAADCLQARLLMASGDWDEALALLDRARGGMTDPAWAARADYLLGTCHARLGDVPQALECHRRAVAAAPGFAPARFGLASALLAAGRPADAAAELRPIYRAHDAPPGTAALLAQALVREGLARPPAERNWEQAEEAVGQAAREAPGSADAALLRAELLAARRHYAAAGEVLDRARGDHPEEVRLWLAPADLALAAGQPDRARAALESAREKFPGEARVLLARARYWAQAGGPEAAAALEELEADCRRQPPGDRPPLLRAVAHAYQAAGEPAAAAAAFAAVAADSPRDLQSRLALLDLALERGDGAAARAAAGELRRVEGDDGALWRYGEAACIVNFSDLQNPQNVDRARALLGDAARRRPDWGRVPLLAGVLDQRTGDEKGAVRHFLRALELGEYQPLLTARLARALYRDGRYLEAELVVARLEEMGPLPPELARVAVDLALTRGDNDRAAALAAQAVPPQTRDYRDRLWLAGVLTRAGKKADAEQVLRDAAARHAETPDVWVALAGHLAQAGRPDAVPTALYAMGQKVPADLLPLTVARCHEAAGDFDRAEAGYLACARADPDDIRVWKRLAEFYGGRGQAAKAEPWLRKLIDPANRLPAEFADPARRRLALDLARAGGGHTDEALSLIGQNFRGGARPEDRLARGVILAARPGSRAEAVRLLEEGLREAPGDHAGAEFALAKLYQAGGEHAKARPVLLRLITADEQPDYLAAYVASLLADRNIDAAGYYLDRLAAVRPDHPRLPELRAELDRTREQIAARGQ